MCVLCSDLNTPVEGHVSKSVMWEVGMLASYQRSLTWKAYSGCQEGPGCQGSVLKGIYFFWFLKVCSFGHPANPQESLGHSAVT